MGDSGRSDSEGERWHDSTARSHSSPGPGPGSDAAAAQLFAGEGAKVVIADLNPDLGAETERLVNDAGGEALFVPTDVTDEEAAAAAVDATVERFGLLNVLYNCAGGSIPEDGPVTEVDMGVWDHTMALDLKGTMFCSRHGVPKIIEAGGGSIVNMSSLAALQGVNMHIYSAAKGGVISLTKSMAAMYSRKGVARERHLSGLVLTDRVKGRFAQQSDEGEPTMADRMARRHPFGVGQPEDIANLALFLASDESRHG